MKIEINFKSKEEFEKICSKLPKGTIFTYEEPEGKGKSYGAINIGLAYLTSQRNKLNRQIATLKKANLNE